MEQIFKINPSNFTIVSELLRLISNLSFQFTEFADFKCSEQGLVLETFMDLYPDEQKELDEILENINNCIIEILPVQNLDRIMQKYNKKKEKLK